MYINSNLSIYKVRFYIKLLSVLAGSFVVGTLPVNAAPQPQSVVEDSLSLSSSMAQVTSVSQLSDVKPTDWAFQALQSLVERYGCIVGYPDKTFRGNRALTRFEFAAGLNACLDKIQELIAAATADFVKKEDLEVVKKLQEEFAAELASLRGRVDALDVRTATLEKQQFSTTTKLSGEVIFSLASAYGAYPGPRRNAAPFNTSRTGLGPVADTTPGRDAEVVFNNRVRLKLLTSFSGKDLLITGLQAYNFGGGAGSLASRLGSLSGTLGYGDGVFGTASNVRLAYEPQFGTTNPSTLGDAPGANNSVGLYKLLYIFPVASKFTAFVGTGAEVDDAFPAIVPFYGDAQEGISRFGQMNPILRISGGTSGIGLASAAGLIWNVSNAIDFRALYGSVNANLPSNLGFPGTPLGAGLFGGSYVAAAQLTIKPSPAFDIALNYAHSYHQINILGLGEAAVAVGAIPNVAPTTPVKLDSFGLTAAYRITPKVSLTGFFFYSFVNAASRIDAGTDILSYMGGIHFKDVLSTGSTAGILFGQPPARVNTSGVASRLPILENAKPYHLEAYYKYRLTDNISITPGLFVIFNPEGFSGNPTVFVPVIRTTFTF
ncbi:MAG: iron uptake porin [Leptolyngbyaceae cyanobacterium CAN_BIN12]|nr:iron uptake porin [Leptolyngbyaceae cyanobacterium CAN_BIN12]